MRMVNILVSRLGPLSCNNKGGSTGLLPRAGERS
jgi:hypothetical protein